MPSLADTIARLSSQRLNTAAGAGVGSAKDHLGTLSGFGGNPGALVARTHVPRSLAPDAPLVVVLHGCTQTAAGYDRAADWSGLADALGFAVLFPEQVHTNNPNRCFNWFVPGDVARHGGEAESIAQMTAALITRHKLDPARVYVTGLSAGGAMTAAMLAAYPDLFAGGAVIAGLPFGAAASMPEAFAAMRGGSAAAPAALAERVRRASRHAGPWPTLSVWHGDADQTVHVSNAALLGSQWRALHGVGAAPDTVITDGRAVRRTWRDGAGRTVVEEHIIAGMGHGTPLGPDGAPGGGRSAPHMLDVGIASTRAIAHAWGLGEPRPVAASAPAFATTPAQETLPALRPPVRLHPSPAPPAPRAAGVQQVIEDALRAAGLMR